MIKYKKTLTIWLVFVMVLTLLPIQANAAKKVKLNKSKLSLYVGKSYKLKLKNNKKKVKWSSSKKKVASVSSKGKVKARRKGHCKIIAKVAKKKYVCKVTVKKIVKPKPTSSPAILPTPMPKRLAPVATPIIKPMPTKGSALTPTPTPSIKPVLASPKPTATPTLGPSSEPSIKPTVTPDYKLYNPRVDDETSVWDLVEFGRFPQSLYTPIKEPDTPKDGTTYIDSDGTSYLCRLHSITTSKKVLNEETQTYETIYTTTTNCYYFKYEPIQWRVLHVSDNEVLLLADKCLNCCAYNNSYSGVTWETCSLRWYLNNTFKKIAFSQAEQDILLQNNVINSRANPYSTEKGGNNTVDEIFLLDIYEMTKKDYGFCEEAESIDLKMGCGSSSNKRKCVCTDYANAGGTYNFKTKYMNWWLRSPGLSDYKAAYINDDGAIDYAITNIVALERHVDQCLGVRPAITINLDDNTTYSKVGTVDEKSNYVIY